MAVFGAIGFLAGKHELVEFFWGPVKTVQDYRAGRNSPSLPGLAFHLAIWLGIALVIGATAPRIFDLLQGDCVARGGHIETPGGGQGVTSCEGAQR